MPVLCFSPEDEAREKEHRVAERLLEFVHGRDQSSSVESDHLLPPVLREVRALTPTPATLRAASIAPFLPVLL
jgi:hypothetical protein